MAIPMFTFPPKIHTRTATSTLGHTVLWNRYPVDSGKRPWSLATGQNRTRSVRIFHFRRRLRRCSTYTIMAYLHDNTPITLQRGIPQTGHVNETEGMYYTFTLNNKKENLQITLTPNDDETRFICLLGQMNATNMISS